MALRGYFPVEKLYTYCELDSILEGHTDMKRTPGLESSGGPLGMGLSVAVGIALGLRMKENPFSRVYCILGDGEVDEGNVWEAAMAAAHYHLDNVIALIDYNKVMAKGLVRDLMNIEPLAAKWSAFGWEVLEVDGHDIRALVKAFYQARWIKPHGLPIMIIAHTVKGRGVESAEFNYKWHTHAPDPKTVDSMLRALARRYEKPEKGYSRIIEPVRKETFYGGE
jgi:transketolase